MTSKSMFGCVRTFKNNLFSTQNRCSMHGNVNGVEIPARIERGPTDILKELSRTVTPVPISYKSHYGIFWQNVSNYDYKYFSLAADSGRKAAKWIVSQNPHLFQHRVSEPYIEAFAPPPEELKEDSEVSEETLINAIQMIRVEYAISVYKLLKEKGIGVSAGTKQKLLELVCYFNCKNKPDITLLETKYFSLKEKKIVSSWKNNDFHMQLFEEMEHNAQSYSALILGSFKYQNAALGLTLYERATEKGIKFGTAVHNELIKNLNSGNNQVILEENSILKKLKEMAKMEIEPDLGTLNNTLYFIQKLKNVHDYQIFALKLLNEFKRIGIQPSLATYSFLLNILFPRNLRNAQYPITYFIGILNEIQNKSFEIEDENDCYFFPNAMEKASYFDRFDLAKRVDEIMNTGYNRAFIYSNFLDLIYYRHFLSILFKRGTPKEASDLFGRIVSNWIINERTLEDVFFVLSKRNDGGKFLPLFWNQFKVSSFGVLKSGMNSFITLLDEKGYQIGGNKDLEIAKEMWDNFEGKFSLSLDSVIASRLIMIFSKRKEKKYAYEVFDFALMPQPKVVQLDFSSMVDFVNLCAFHNDMEKAMECIAYSFENQPSCSEQLIDHMKKTFKLSEGDWSKLQSKIDSIKKRDYDTIII